MATGPLVLALAGCGGATPSSSVEIGPSFLSVANYSPNQVAFSRDLDRFNTKWWLGGETLSAPVPQTAMLRRGYRYIPSFNTGYMMRTHGLTALPAGTTKGVDPHSCIDNPCPLNLGAMLAEAQRAQNFLRGHSDYYNIGNEEDNYSSDDVSPSVYVGQFDAWLSVIRRRDRSPRIVAPSIGSWSCCTTKATSPFGTAGQWFRAFVAAYQGQHGGAMPPIDVLSMHLYNYDPATAYPNLGKADNYVAEVRSFREAADSLGYQGRPIWITELGFLYPPGGPLTATQSSQITRVVQALARAAGKLNLERVFWFTDNEQAPVAAGLRPLYAPTAVSTPATAMPLSDLGQLVVKLANSKP